MLFDDLTMPACLPAIWFRVTFFFSSHFHLWNKKCNRNKNKSYKFLYPMFSKMYEIFFEKKSKWKSVCTVHAYVMQYFINWKLIITSYDVSAVAIIMLFFFYFNRFSDSRGEFTFHNWQFTMRECLIKNNIYRKICIISFVQSKWYPLKMTLFHHPF